MMADGQVYHITPTTSEPCPAELCLTLSQFASDAESYVKPNAAVRLVFQPGNHSLSSELFISNVQEFSMMPLPSSTNSLLNVNIVCKLSANFTFQASNQVLVKNLTFIGCGGSRIVEVNQFTVEGSSFLGIEDDRGALEILGSGAHIIRTTFTGCELGGVMHLYRSVVLVSGCIFTNNRAPYGGVMFLHETIININHCEFHNNTADSVGGVIYADRSKVNLSTSNFSNNSANDSAAVHAADSSNLNVVSCKFHSNVANNSGGAMAIFTKSRLNLRENVFTENVARYAGGALMANEAIVNINESALLDNRAENGGAIYAYSRSFIVTSNTSIVGNRASSGVVSILGSKANFSSNTLYSNNVGSLLVFNSKVAFTGNSDFVKNDHPALESNVTVTGIEEGGTLTTFQSEIFFDGTCTLMQNRAKKGGAIHAIESKLYVNGEVIIANNTAMETGGGMYIYQSELIFQGHSNMKVLGNSAYENGGGIHSIGSSIDVKFSVYPFVYINSSTVNYIYTGSVLSFTENRAAKGGGIYLEAQAKIYILKDYPPYRDPDNPIYVLTFSSNSAKQGGAVYVADSTNQGTCTSASYKAHSATSKCFLQVLALHGRRDSRLNTVNAKFEQNRATISGSTLFGGLLDRCTASPFAEVYYKYKESSEPDPISGLEYLMTTSNIQNNLDTISSDPVRLCFCRGD